MVLISNFIGYSWVDVGDHLLGAIKYFFSNAVMPKVRGRTYVTLTPKKEHPKTISNFRPISLCNGFYNLTLKFWPII